MYEMFDEKEKKRIKIERKNISLVLISSIIAALSMVVFKLFPIDNYTKNFILPMFLLLVEFTFLAYKLGWVISLKSYLILFSIILILVSKLIIPIDFSNIFLNVLIVPLLMSIFFFLTSNKNYDITGTSISWLFKLFPSGLFQNFSYLKEYVETIKKRKNTHFLNIISGILLSIPLILVLLMLLTSADEYFNNFISNIASGFSNITKLENWSNYIVVFLCSFILFFVVLINVLKNRDLKMKEITHKTVNNDITATILVMVNSVFVLFLISEISKLTTNFLHVPIGYTYASYAREGFFQLLFITIINFAIIIYYLYKTNIVKKSKFVKNCLLLLISFSILLIFNSYYRMFLYISEYGFTILRLQVILFLLMELILFGVLIKKIISKLKFKDAYIFFTVMLTTYIINIYFCSKPFISLLNFIYHNY